MYVHIYKCKQNPTQKCYLFKDSNKSVPRTRCLQCNNKLEEKQSNNLLTNEKRFGFCSAIDLLLCAVQSIFFVRYSMFTDLNCTTVIKFYIFWKENVHFKFKPNNLFSFKRYAAVANARQSLRLMLQINCVDSTRAHVVPVLRFFEKVEIYQDRW